MSGRLIAVTGTGTEIGKTHVSEAILLRLRSAGDRVAGVKPIESGIGTGVTDAERLAQASAFHVKHPAVRLRTPVSPHLAARLEGVSVDIPALVAGIQAAREGLDALLVEFPGGLFSPVTDELLNVDLITQLRCDHVLLVAPDRLGVLHEVIATARAAMTVDFRALLLVEPSSPDASTGTNAAELQRLVGIPLQLAVPRGTVTRLSGHPAIAATAEALRRSGSDRDPA